MHLPTWVGGVIERRVARVLGQDWAMRTLDVPAWEALREIPDKDLWEAHQAQKQRLLRHVRARLRDMEARHGEPPDELRRVGRLFSVDHLTLVFARRFAAYKRVGLLLSDMGRFQALLTNPERPVQIVFGGKAHPADREGQDLIRRVVQLAKDPRFEGHVAYVEDYDMELARYLLAGADVWVNVPRPPMEASGTSGMKAAINGVPNLSVLDGWWLEGFNGRNGWGFGEVHHSDDADAATLYHLIEHEVAPLYYERDPDGVPRRWVAMMKEAMIAAVPFSASRMVAEYIERLYVRATATGIPRRPSAACRGSGPQRRRCLTSTPPSTASTCTSSRGLSGPTPRLDTVSSQAPTMGRPRTSTAQPWGTITSMCPNTEVADTRAPAGSSLAPVRSRRSLPKTAVRAARRRPVGPAGQLHRVEQRQAGELGILDLPPPQPPPPAEQPGAGQHHQDRPGHRPGGLPEQPRWSPPAAAARPRSAPRPPR